MLQVSDGRAKIFVSEIVPNQEVASFFVVEEKQLRVAKNGTPFPHSEAGRQVGPDSRAHLGARRSMVSGDCSQIRGFRSRQE